MKADIKARLQLFPLLRIAVFMALGIFTAYESRSVMPSWAWMAALVVAMTVVFLMIRREEGQGVALCVAAFALGGAWNAAKIESLMAELPKGDITYHGVVASQPQERGKVMRFDLWIVDGGGMPRRVKASLLRDTLSGKYLSLDVGDGIVATSEMHEPENYYESNFNYPLYLRCHGFTATTLILPGSWREARVSLENLSYIERTVLAAKRFRQATLRHYLSLGLNDEEMAVAVAMALGDRSRITNDLRDIYSISGASHVLALSGMHLGIIYMLLSLMLGVRRLGAFREMLVIGGIWCYAVFTGLSPSVVRASVMISIYAVVGLLRRDRMSLNALGLTAIVMFLANPMCLYDVGFQMSFLAVLAILLYYKPLYGLVSREYLMSHKVVHWIWAMVVVSCCAQLGVAPLTAYYFGRFSVYFLLTNFIVIPLATVILYLTAAMLAASLVPVVMQWVARLLAVVVGWQTNMVRWVAALPGSSIEGLTMTRIQLLLVYVVIAALTVAAYRMGWKKSGNAW